MGKQVIIPQMKKLYPGENPRLKLLSLCATRGGQRLIAQRLGVSEAAVGQMLRRIRHNQQRYGLRSDNYDHTSTSTDHAILSTSIR